MIKFYLGQKVKAIDDDTHGIVTHIDDNQITIENEFGFDESYLPHELLPDVGLEDEIENIDVPKPQKTKKNNSFQKKKKKITGDFQRNLSSNYNTEFERLVENNMIQNPDEFKNKLEERYKKEIKKSKKRTGTFVLDLHYGKLESYSKQLPTEHILQKQLTAAINGIEKAKNQGYEKIILVHGKGKGILENEIKKYLNDYDYVFYDANFAQYKLGATEVVL